ncbi:MAG: PQQ-binding-like beta-propeller repeat protein [Planctomyces sp.]|nr:PQQ-binding-like beta-propeller repeat protein [Planctomyces sp.]
MHSLRLTRRILLVSFSVLLLSSMADAGVKASSFGSTVSYFRRDQGLAPAGTVLPTDFSEGAGRLWRSPVDPGISSPCVAGGLVVVTTWKDGDKELATVALDRTSGQQVWKRVSPLREVEPFHSVGSPASSTPASNGEQLFVFFGSYGLLCYDLNGKLLWEQPMGPFQDEFGASSSPVLSGNNVVLNEDHDVQSFICAFDQATGELRWKTDREAATRSYSTPFLIGPQGEEQIVIAGSLQMTAYSPNDGTRLWWYDGLSRIVDSTPVVVDGKIIAATWTPGGDSEDRIVMEPFADALKTFDTDDDQEIGESELPEGNEILQRFFRIDLNQNHKLDEAEWIKHSKVFERAKNVAVSLAPGTEGPVAQENVQWTYTRGLPTVPSSVVYDGILYMVKDSGIITSVDIQTGEMLKQGRAIGRGNYYASLVAGDGKVYMISESGVMTILKAGRDWEIVGSHDFGERVLATPVFADGMMIIRTDAAVYAFATSN